MFFDPYELEGYHLVTDRFLEVVERLRLFGIFAYLLTFSGFTYLKLRHIVCKRMLVVLQDQLDRRQDETCSVFFVVWVCVISHPLAMFRNGVKVHHPVEPLMQHLHQFWLFQPLCHVDGRAVRWRRPIMWGVAHVGAEATASQPQQHLRRAGVRRLTRRVNKEGGTSSGRHAET